MHKKIFVLLWIGCMLGAAAILPYVYFLGLTPPMATSTLVFQTVLQAGIVYGIVCLISFFLVPRAGLKPFGTTPFPRKVLYPGVIGGALVGLVLLLLDRWIFDHSALAAVKPPVWAGALASFYGGINEEVFSRLFLLTLILFLLGKLFKREKYRTPLIWTAILVAAVAFSAGHLIISSKMGEFSGLEVLRILAMNTFAGAVFGWLYCYRGFWAAALAHFCTDLVIHALLI